MCAWLLTNPRRRTDADRQRDATLLVALAYAGLRPESEALTLRWEHVRLRVLEVPAGRKRGARDRTVRMLAPLRADLAAWRLAMRRPRSHELVPPRFHRPAGADSASSPRFGSTSREPTPGSEPGPLHYEGGGRK